MTLIGRFAPYIRSSPDYHLAETNPRDSRSDVLAYSEDIVYPPKPQDYIDLVVKTKQMLLIDKVIIVFPQIYWGVGAAHAAPHKTLLQKTYFKRERHALPTGE